MNEHDDFDSHDEERRHLWVQFAAAALAGITGDDFNELQCAKFAAATADAMLDEYNSRFLDDEDNPYLKLSEDEE